MTTAKTTDAVTTQNLIAERTTKALVTAASGVEKVVNTVVAGLNTEVNAAVQNLSNLSEQVQSQRESYSCLLASGWQVYRLLSWLQELT